MEYLDGCDLSALAKQRTAISAAEASEYILQACEALAEAHSLGIVHRDIKLANLFVTRGPAGTPLLKVLDFGISKVNPFGESEHDMTRTTSMLGSPRFMSPEQMRDPRAVDGRTDIWSLGVVLYRLVAGRPPFEAETLGRLLTMVMHEQEAPLNVVRSDCPLGLELVVGRCLAKDTRQRWSNVGELAYALVPYCVDPARARASADRIAAMLTLSQNPTVSQTGPFMPVGAPPSPGRPSAPPGHIDTGSAAPWAGTHGTSRNSSRLGVLGAGIALATLLVGGVLYAKLSQSAPAPVVGTEQQGATETTPAPPPTDVADSPASSPTLTTATATTTASPAATHTVVLTPSAPRAQTPVFRPAATKPKTPRPAPKANDDGIPNSRD
jgi:serine/threonine-protein kinase